MVKHLGPKFEVWVGSDSESDLTRIFPGWVTWVGPVTPNHTPSSSIISFLRPFLSPRPHAPHLARHQHEPRQGRQRGQAQRIIGSNTKDDQKDSIGEHERPGEERGIGGGRVPTPLHPNSLVQGRDSRLERRPPRRWPLWRPRSLPRTTTLAPPFTASKGVSTFVSAVCMLHCGRGV